MVTRRLCNLHRKRRHSTASTGDGEGDRASPLGWGRWSEGGFWWRRGLGRGGLCPFYPRRMVHGAPSAGKVEGEGGRRGLGTGGGGVAFLGCVGRFGTKWASEAQGNRGGRVWSFLHASCSMKELGNGGVRREQVRAWPGLSKRVRSGGSLLIHGTVVSFTGREREVANVDVSGAACTTAIGGWRAWARESEGFRECPGERESRAGTRPGRWSLRARVAEREEGVRSPVGFSKREVTGERM
jgi:hypothetical protein